MSCRAALIPSSFASCDDHSFSLARLWRRVIGRVGSVYRLEGAMTSCNVVRIFVNALQYVLYWRYWYNAGTCQGFHHSTGPLAELNH